MRAIKDKIITEPIRGEMGIEEFSAADELSKGMVIAVGGDCDVKTGEVVYYLKSRVRKVVKPDTEIHCLREDDIMAID